LAKNHPGTSGTGEALRFDALASNAIGLVAQLNLAFSRRRRPGLSDLARLSPRLLTAAFLAGPNAWSAPNQAWPVPRVEKRSGALFDRLGHVRLKSAKLEIKLDRDSSQTDFVTKT
jgi:hypothetical protein